MAVGPYATSPYYMETKMAQNTAMKNAKQVILDVAKEFEEMTGRHYGFFEEYRLDDADYAIVMIGSAAGTTKKTTSVQNHHRFVIGFFASCFENFPMITPPLSYLQ